MQPSIEALRGIGTLTSFSDSPRHFDMSVEALKLKNFTPVLHQIAFPNSV